MFWEACGAITFAGETLDLLTCTARLSACASVANQGASVALYPVAGHDEQWVHLKTLEFRAQTVCVIEPLYIDGLLSTRHDIHRNVIVAAILEHYQASVHFLENQVECKIPICHRD